MFPLNSSPKTASEGSGETFTVTTTYWCTPYSIPSDKRIDYFGMSGRNRSLHADGGRDKQKGKTGEDQAMSSSITEQRSPSSVPQTGRDERKRRRDGGGVSSIRQQRLNLNRDGGGGWETQGKRITQEMCDQNVTKLHPPEMVLFEKFILA